MKVFQIACGLLVCFFLSFVSCTPANTNSDSGETIVEKDGTCEVSSNCSSCSQECKASQCVEIACQSDAECRCNWTCFQNKCYEPSKAPCESDADCKNSPKLWKCENKQCIDGGCRNDNDCALSTATPLCDTTTHQCIKKKCTQHLDCTDSTKPFCQKETGDCVVDPGLEIDNDCSQKACKLSLHCYQKEQTKTCKATCNPYDRNACSSKEICVAVQDSGVCLSAGNGLKEGDDCSGGKACEANLHCVFDNQKEICQRICLNDNHCTTSELCSEYRNIKVCLPKPEPCGLGRPCLGERDKTEQCVNGLCKAILCVADKDCLPTHKCQANGRCIPKVCPADSCGSLYKCENNACVKTNEGEACGAGTSIDENKCGDNLICAKAGYVDVCLPSCSASPCREGFRCETNIDGKFVCLQNCPADNKCAYEGYLCLNKKRYPKGNFCLPAGQPVGGDIFDKCDKDTNPCLPDLKCYHYSSSKSGGYCVAPCQKQSDCSAATLGFSGAKCYDSYSYGQNCYLACGDSDKYSTVCSGNGISGTCYSGGTVVGTNDYKYFCTIR